MTPGNHIRLFGLLSFVCLCFGEQPYKVTSEEDEKDDSNIYVYPAGFKGGRYYYGGIYRGSCHNDGLYYRDDNSFMICSNGNAYVQPCAPGTKSSGQHRYSPGYYYGYSDFCDINLVDQGYGPAHYAPYGVRTHYDKSANYDDEDGYNQKKSTSYGSDRGYGPNSGYDRYPEYHTDSYSSYGSNKPTYGTSNDLYATKNKGYNNVKDVYGTGQAYSPEQQQKLEERQQQLQQKHAPRYSGRDNGYDTKETAYEPNKNANYQ